MRLTRSLAPAFAVLCLAGILAFPALMFAQATEELPAPVVAPGETPPVVVQPDGDLQATEPLVDAPIVKPGGGLSIPPILAIVGAIVGVLTALSKFFPSYRTQINLALIGLTSLSGGLTDLMETHEEVTFLAIGFMVIGAIVAAFKKEKRAKAAEARVAVLEAKP